MRQLFGELMDLVGGGGDFVGPPAPEGLPYTAYANQFRNLLLQAGNGRGGGFSDDEAAGYWEMFLASRQIEGAVPNNFDREFDQWYQSMFNQAIGVADVPPKALRAHGIAPGGSGGPMSQNLYQEDYAPGHPTTYVPRRFRMYHHRIGAGAHLAMLGSVIVMKFHNKRSCAAFCRSWNDLMSHVGSADPFIPGDVVQVFADVLIGGSGATGAQNEFNPPFKGRV